MKIGEKIYCIKDYELNSCRFIANQYYIIENFDTAIDWSVVCLINNIWFYTNKKDVDKQINKGYSPYFGEYFITLKDHRKLKLKKLSHENR